MSYGNILQAIEAKFGFDLGASDLESIYHRGDLKPLLPDGCCWVSIFDDDHTLLEIEPIEVSSVNDMLPVKVAREGSMIVRRESPDESNFLLIVIRPNCDLQFVPA